MLLGGYGRDLAAQAASSPPSLTLMRTLVVIYYLLAALPSPRPRASLCSCPCHSVRLASRPRLRTTERMQPFKRIWPPMRCAMGSLLMS